MEHITFNAVEIPSWRHHHAVERGVEKNIILVSWGGLGDQVCTLPTAKYMLDRLLPRGYNVHFGTAYPAIAEGLPFTSVVDMSKGVPPLKDYYMIPLGVKPETLLWEFMQHGTMHAVDFASMCALKMQLPINDRVIPLVCPTDVSSIATFYSRSVVVHAGSGWTAKTFPLEWWQRVCDLLTSFGYTVILVGDNSAVPGRGVVPISARKGYVDLRNKLSLRELIYVLLKASEVLTTDSAPYHIACAGQAKIGYFSTAKHPDLLTHYRKDEYGRVSQGWNVTDLAKGGTYERLENFFENVSVSDASPDEVARWLPSPDEVVTNWLMP